MAKKKDWTTDLATASEPPVVGEALSDLPVPGADGGVWGTKLNAWLTALRARVVTATVTPTDGQTQAWSQTLGQWVPVNPTGPSELASAQNVTGTVTTATTTGGVGAVVDVLGCTISVPPSNGRPVTIEFGATFYQTVVGAGSIYLELNETTGGGNTNVKSAIAPAPQRSGAIDAAQCVMTIDSQFRIGVVNTARQFKLSVVLYTSGGSLTGNLLNAATSPTYMTAIAR